MAMKKLMEKVERLLVAAAFAEAGEHEVSLRMLGQELKENRAARPAATARVFSR
jgi:hypothetical protein